MSPGTISLEGTSCSRPLRMRRTVGESIFFRASRALSARYSWTKPSRAQKTTMTKMSAASKSSPTRADRTVATSRMMIRMFLNWPRKIVHGETLSSFLSSFGPWTSRRLATSASCRPVRASVSRARSASAASRVCHIFSVISDPFDLGVRKEHYHTKTRGPFKPRPGRRSGPVDFREVVGDNGIFDRDQEAPMRMKLRWMTLALILSLVLAAGADEGMWMPHQMIGLNLKSLGLQMDPGDLYKKDGTGLMSAVVNLGGGTGEFVSPEGLVLTNHHVAYGAIQRASSKEKDYITDGFMARTRGEEIQAQGYQVGVLLGYEDVTAKVNAYFKPKMTPRERYDAFDKAQKDLIAAGEKAGQGPALHPGLDVQRQRLLPLHVQADPRRPARLRAAPGPGQLRRRDRQLDVAPPHLRFLLPAGLRRARRDGGRFQPVERPLQTQGLAEGLARRLQGGRFHLRHGLSGPDLPQLRPGRAQVRPGEHGQEDQGHPGPHRLLRGRREEPTRKSRSATPGRSRGSTTD